MTLHLREAVEIYLNCPKVNPESCDRCLLYDRERPADYCICAHLSIAEERIKRVGERNEELGVFGEGSPKAK